MPNRQSHRGKHPQDAKLFAGERLPALRAAVADLSFLLSRGYSDTSALKLVGDHFQLAARQRRAVLGAACSDESLEGRRARRVAPGRLRGRRLVLDGYNVLIIIESALSGGVLLRGRDGCIRDLASVHGSYHKVAETRPAIEQVGAALERLGIAQCLWLFDAPVSNSGRLKQLVLSTAAERGWRWHVELTVKTDDALAKCGDIVATSDGWILDRATQWANLVQRVIEALQPQPRVLDLRPRPRNPGASR
ncbi:MAG: DUF434 domain-containing protein [Candidatus Hydrogenedentes bacterium]|nr:DUF434 domain-containing protein [Candidatus Hydrogenedentota bacterium]